MKKNTTYILLGLAVLGGAWYFMKSKQKKGTVIVPEPETITQEQFEQTEQASPLKALVDVVKKVAKPNAAKKMQRQEARAAKKETRKAKKLGEISVLI